MLLALYVAGTFTACNSGPTLQITSPEDGAAFLAGSPLRVEAVVSDDKTDAAEMRWRWTLGGQELEGEIGFGAGVATLEAAPWPLAGEQELVVQAADAGGLLGEDRIVLVVAEGSDPAISFLSPAAGARLPAGAPAQIVASVTDADEADPASLTLSWSGAAGADHPDASGQAAAEIVDPAAGYAQITLSAVDPQGRSASATLTLEFFADDDDGDGFVDVASGGDDCDDADASVNPGAAEVCDGIDQDCDGAADDDPADGGVWYADGDGDGFGAGAAGRFCAQPGGYVAEGTDCDDGAAGVNPGAAEVCDGVDTDCDGELLPEEIGDADGDGYGGCGDCDDADPAVNPGAQEVCDAGDVDEDCDGLSDDDDGSVDAAGYQTWYRDADADGYGATTPTTSACDVPAGYAAVAGDCADSSRAISPGVAEVCGDGTDNDCDGDDPRCRPVGAISLSAADLWWDGEVALDDAGGRVAVGDLDGDGELEGIVAARWQGASDDGAAYLIGLGGAPSGSLLSAQAAIRGVSGEQAGSAVAARDLDGDGLAEVLLGAWGADYGRVNAGAAYVLAGAAGTTGSASATLTGEGMTDLAGAAICGGDLDGDGIGEVVVGAYGSDRGGANAGAVYVVEGPAGTVALSAAGGIVEGSAAEDFAGYAVAAGDVDGDGADDLWIGGYGADGGGSASGAAWLLYGPVAGVVDLSAADERIDGLAADDQLGSEVGVGDVDGDGRGDLWAGAALDGQAARDAGAVFVFFSPVSGSAAQADAILLGEDADDRLGAAVAAGDVDGDGAADLLVGAWYDDAAGLGAGAAYLFYGPVSGTVGAAAAGFTAEAGSSRDNAGRGVALGDLDGDGFDDLLIGAPVAGTGGGAYAIWGGGF